MYYIFAFLIGVLIVSTMAWNGKLSKKLGMEGSIFINYLVAFLLSGLFGFILMDTRWDYNSLKSVPGIFLSGGILGVTTTWLFNLIIHQIPTVYIVVLRFIGQLLTSAFIDYLWLHEFSIHKLLGGILFFLGLAWNAKVDALHLGKHAKKDIHTTQVLSKHKKSPMEQ